MRINSQPTRLLIAVLFCIGLICLARTQQTPAKDPTDKTAAGVPDTQKLAGTEDDRFAPKLSEAQQQIEAALAKQVTCKYHSMPLSEVVADLARQVELPIDLDDQGLEEAGVDRTTPISLEAGPLSLRAVLTLLEVRHHLGYMPGLGGLQLTSEEIAEEEENQVVRVYPMIDLLEAFSVPEFGGEHDGLGDFIRQHVSPDSWAETGGPAVVSGYGGSLVIRQTLARHHDVASLVAGVRKLKRDHAAKKPSVVKTIAGPAEEALSKLVSGEAKTDLNDFLTQIGDAVKTPIVVSLEGLESADVELTSNVRGTYRDQPAGKVLKALLRPLHLAAFAYPEFVLITEEDDDPVHETRIYPVGDLPVAKVREAYRGGTCALSMHPASDELMDLITAAVMPESWADYGGQGQISSIQEPPAIAVTACCEVQAQVQQLLSLLRETSKEKAALDRQADEKIVERFYTLYLSRRQLKAELSKRKADPPAAAAPSATPPAGTEPPSPAPPAKPASEDDPFGSNLRRAQDPLAQFGMGGMGGMGGKGGYLGFPPTPIAEPIPTADDVAKLIRELLPDPSWKEEGVLLRPFHDVLIVRQRGPMLRKIERLLESIDAWHDPRMRGFGPGVCGQIIPVVGDYSEKPRSQ